MEKLLIPFNEKQRNKEARGRPLLFGVQHPVVLHIR